MHLLDIIRRFKGRIFLATSLVVIENVAWIIEPSVFGTVIDALIDAASKGTNVSALSPLLIWIGVFSVNSGVGSIRRSFDQKIYLRMFTEIATSVLQSSIHQNLSISRTAARAQLSKEFITFFQYRIPEIIEQIISIGGALIGLAFFDYRIALTCFIVVLPLLAVNILYNKKVVVLQANIHDSAEDAYEIFSTRDPETVKSYYSALAIPQQKIANWGALTFGTMRFFLLGIFLAVLYISIDLDDFTTGNIYSIVAYIWTFVNSSEYLPELMESWTSLKDISKRLKAD
jgi:ABC-type multidrug transport system fused ATPase/permease subunit